ncbi:MAG: hypothetical protein WBO24_01040 [Nitrospirales bacterium]
MLVKTVRGLIFSLLLMGPIGCSGTLESQETFSQQKKENDSLMCEKITDGRMGGRGVPGWQSAYEECMVTGGQ